MNPALAALAVGVVAGGVVAVSARDARMSMVGLAAALVFAPLVAEPFPDGLVVAMRVVAALLAVYLLWVVAREGFDIRQPRLRWPVELLIAAAAGLAGLSSPALTTPPISEVAAVGLPVARGAAFAIGALAIIPILEGRDALRLGTGLVLAVLAVTLLQQGIGSAVPPIEHLAFAGVMVGVAATSAGLGSIALAVADRAERPVRAGAHPIGHGAEAGGAVPPAGYGARVRDAEAALRGRLATARVADRIALAGGRSRGAVARIRSARPGLGTAAALRQRLERPAREPASDEAIVQTTEQSIAAEPAADTDPIMEEPAQRPSAVSPRSAGARRSLRRRE